MEIDDFVNFSLHVTHVSMSSALEELTSFVRKRHMVLSALTQPICCSKQLNMTSFSHYNYITNMENPPSLGLKVAIIEGSVPLLYPYCITGASVQLV